jgi:hypothetical protein
MHTLRTPLFALALLVLAPLTAQAQPAVVPGTTLLLFDHDGLRVDKWERQIDAEAWAAVSPVKGAQVGTTTPAVFVWSIPFPAVTPGPHTITLRACNAAGCAASPAFAFTVIAMPSAPANIRIGETAAPE